MVAPNPHDDDAATDRAGLHRILVVEGRAHEPMGHYAVTFARFAEALTGLGHEVTLLTSRGWALEGDPALAPLEVHAYGRLALTASRVVGHLGRLRWHSIGRRLQPVAVTALLVTVARMWARRANADAVVVVTLCDPVTASVFAGPGRWICFAHGRPVGWERHERAWGYRVLVALSRRAEARRRRRSGHGLRIATTTEQSRRGWRTSVPWCTSVSVPLGVTGTSVPVTNPRAELGLPAGERLALFFGVPHPGKDPETVWRAFRLLPEWHLVVAGQGSADAYRRWAAENVDAVPEPAPILIDGFVDERTKHLLHCAVDVAMLSFRPGWPEDSGTFADALDGGTAVVCSEGSSSTDLVRRHRLGAVYRTGDPDGLAAAVRDVGDAPDQAGLARARDELSVAVSVQRCLDGLRAKPEP